jgi:predicted DNA-binding protein (MmcQ/YjbR family)
MAHPKMFDDDDPVLAHVRSLALDYPGAAEKVSHGRPAFFTGKIFAYYGGSVKAADGWTEHPQSVLVLPDPDDRRSLVEESRVWVPAYLGPSGWLGIDLDDRTDWGEIDELLDASYRRTASKRLVGQLESIRTA